MTDNRPGWRQDPLSGRGWERYWDGRHWTTEVRVAVRPPRPSRGGAQGLAPWAGEDHVDEQYDDDPYDEESGYDEDGPDGEEAWAEGHDDTGVTILGAVPAADGPGDPGAGGAEPDPGAPDSSGDTPADHPGDRPPAEPADPVAAEVAGLIVAEGTPSAGGGGTAWTPAGGPLPAFAHAIGGATVAVGTRRALVTAELAAAISATGPDDAPTSGDAAVHAGAATGQIAEEERPEPSLLDIVPAARRSGRTRVRRRYRTRRALAARRRAVAARAPRLAPAPVDRGIPVVAQAGVEVTAAPLRPTQDAATQVPPTADRPGGGAAAMGPHFAADDAGAQLVAGQTGRPGRSGLLARVPVGTIALVAGVAAALNVGVIVQALITDHGSTKTVSTGATVHFTPSGALTLPPDPTTPQTFTPAPASTLPAATATPATTAAPATAPAVVPVGCPHGGLSVSLSLVATPAGTDRWDLALSGTVVSTANAPLRVTSITATVRSNGAAVADMSATPADPTIGALGHSALRGSAVVSSTAVPSISFGGAAATWATATAAACPVPR